MGNFKSFDELKRARLAAYNGMAEGDVLGFLDQHTGFYPDPTHFIYELLQNAEDMNATEVSFRLFPDKLFFEHNGTKRDFELTDIDAITNKGKSPKADDPTQIGKFGMGFKAVYVYTTTPEIHSGEFDFRIENVIIPTDENVPKLAKKGFTQFIFPFNNPKKTAEEAVNEITEALLTLNETAILFLTNIKKINYNLPDDKEGYITLAEKVQNIRFLYSTTVKRPDAEKEITYWAKFFDKCPLIVNEISSGNAIKNFPVSIAYRLIKTNDDKFTLDNSLIGKVCLFFPTEIDSLLHFHINAPFASTVARDNILSKGEDGEANEKLINQLAELTVESLHWLKKAKMLDYAAYATLPTTRDFDNKPDSRYNVFAIRVKEEFEREELFITDKGDYASIVNIFKAANKDIRVILTSNDVEQLYQKSWIPTVQAVTRVEYFINQFDIKEYSIENFIDALETNPHFFDDVLLKHINDEDYYKTLYILLSKAKSREDYKYDFYSKHTQTKNDILKKVSFILCDDNKLHRIEDNIFIKTNYTPKHYLKNPIYLKVTFKNSMQDNDIKRFLLNLGIEEMCESVDLLADVSEDNISIDDNVHKIREIIERYISNTIDIKEYTNKCIFLAYDRNNKKISKVKAKDCCRSKASAFFFRDTTYILAWDKYQAINEYLPVLEDIFYEMGGKNEPKIVQSRTPWTSFPPYNLFDRTKERSDTCVALTYTIAEFNYHWAQFEMISKNNLIAEALLLWNVIVNCNNKDYLFTKYKSNRSAKLQQNESTLVYYLKRTAWVPTKNGIYKRPYELTDDDLLDEFKYEQQSLLLAEISKRPNTSTVEKIKGKDIELSPDDEWFLNLSDEEKQKFRKIADRTRRESKTQDISEALAAENKDQLPYDEEDDYGRDISIKNVTKRQQKQQQDFEEGLTVAPSRKQVWHYTYLSTSGKLEKQFINEQYHGKCQICGRPAIRKFNGQPYFEAINVINTANLDPKYQSSLDAGWNTLCLCPNCAAEYRYCAKDLSDLEKQVENTQIEDHKNEYIEVYITLKGLRTKIMYTPRHFSALQTAFKAFKNHNTN